MAGQLVSKAATIAATGLLLAIGPAVAADEPSTGFTWWDYLQLFLFLVVVFGAIGGWLILSGSVDRDQARVSQSWPTVAGRIVSSEVDQSTKLSSLFKSDDSGDRYTYTPRVQYTFDVGDKSYTGATIKFGLASSSSSWAASKDIDPYPIGAEVPVHYKPDEPEKSVLDTSEANAKAKTIVGYCMLALPFVVMAAIFAVRLYHAR